MAVNVTDTVPSPVPLAPLPIVIQPRSDAAVQAQCEGADTDKDALPAVAGNESDVVERVKVQVAGGVGCVGDLLWHAQTASSATQVINTRAAVRRIATSGGITSKPAATADA